MVCPLLGGQCVKQDCALWFQEVDEKDRPVVNMCGCSIRMTAQYLMEIRPEAYPVWIAELPGMDERGSGPPS